MPKSYQVVDTETWKAASKAEKKDLALAKSNSAAPDIIEKDLNGQPVDRALGFTISTAARDRDGDRISLSGWDLANYRKNPVVPWGHNYSEPPIGKTLSIGVEKDKGRLYAVKQFAPKDVYPFAFMIYELAKTKFLNTASVGFIPRDYIADEKTKDDVEGARIGYYHRKQELLESSIVTVPSNPQALAEARSMHGIDLSPYVDFAEKILDGEKGPGLWVPKKSVEELFQVVSPAKPTVIVPDNLEKAETTETVAPAKKDIGTVITALNAVTSLAASLQASVAGLVEAFSEHESEEDAEEDAEQDMGPTDAAPAGRGLLPATPSTGWAERASAVFGGDWVEAMKSAVREAVKEERAAVLASLEAKSETLPEVTPGTADTTIAATALPASNNAAADEAPILDLESLYVLSLDEERDAEPDNKDDQEGISEADLLAAVADVLGAP